MSEKQIPADEGSVPFYPDHVTTELKVAVGFVILALIVGALGLAFPVGLGDQADPMNTPAHVKPEWYFLALYQVLKFVPKTTGAMIPVVIVIGLLVWPFLDRRPDRSPRTRRIRFGVIAAMLIILVGLTIWGEVS